MENMARTIWTLPVAATALEKVEFSELPKRTCTLLCEYEDDEGRIASLLLTFGEVEAVKSTYDHACTAEMVDMAYGKVVDAGSSEWLTTVRNQLESYNDALRDPRAKHSKNVCDHLDRYLLNTADLRHLMIYFDDGPCYEFICRKFEFEEKTIQGQAYKAEDSQERENRHTTTMLPRELSMATKRGLKIKRLLKDRQRA